MGDSTRVYQEDGKGQWTILTNNLPELEKFSSNLKERGCENTLRKIFLPLIDRLQEELELEERKREREAIKEKKREKKRKELDALQTMEPRRKRAAVDGAFSNFFETNSNAASDAESGYESENDNEVPHENKSDIRQNDAEESDSQSNQSSKENISKTLKNENIPIETRKGRSKADILEMRIPTSRRSARNI
jgi:hypothetical protein